MMRSRTAGIEGLRICLAAAALCSALGCYINYPEYPPEWPRLSSSGSIETDIQGTFSCSGELVKNSAGARQRISVSELLLGGRQASTCDYLEIKRVEPDGIDILFVRSGSLVLQQSLRNGRDYHLDESWIVLNSSSSWGAEEVAAFHESVHARLTLNTKRDLIIKMKNTILQTILVVLPAVSSGMEWGRFKRKE